MENERNSLKNDLKDSEKSAHDVNDFKYDELNARQGAALHAEIKPDNSFKLKRFVVVIAALGAFWGIGNVISNFSIPFYSSSEEVVFEAPIIEETTAIDDAIPVNTKIEGSYLDYLTTLKEANLFDSYEGFERQAFYDAGIDVEYLLNLRENAFTAAAAIPFHEIIAYKNAGLSVNELVRLKENGLLDILAFHELIAFSNAGITETRLFELKDLGFFDTFAFHEIIGFENNGISTDYILSLQKEALLNDIEFFEIIHFWQNEVPVNYLVSLKEKGLLSDLTFYEISKMFKDASN